MTSPLQTYLQSAKRACRLARELLKPLDIRASIPSPITPSPLLFLVPEARDITRCCGK
jgi:hypothetical protein